MCSSAGGSEFRLQPDDRIALVGGEGMVAAGECGYLELLLTCAMPERRLRFRTLAWEGDTVFEQFRDLNFPAIEAQLDKIGATVVIAQFGAMESFAGKGKLPEFLAAYEKLIDRLRADGKRRVIIVSPSESGDPHQAQPPQADRLYKADAIAMRARERVLEDYAAALQHLAEKKNCAFVDLTFPGVTETQTQRDGVHLDDHGQQVAALAFCSRLSPELKNAAAKIPSAALRADNPLLQLVRAKNRLWFHYWRPQNWAFLNGDRTAQPSSRDHLDPSKRWFPDEIEQFVPLIEAKEREIDALAKTLSK